MTEPNHREHHLNYVGMRANRDVQKVFMWLKLGLGTVGLLVTVGYFFLSNDNIGSEAGAYVFISFIPLIVLILGLIDLFTLSLSKLVENRMRRNDRLGRSNRRHLVVVTIGGFVLLHLLMIKSLGSGYLFKVLTPGPDGYNATGLFLVLTPYAAFAGLMLYNWLTPEAGPTDLPEEEEVALAEKKRRSLRLAILGIYAVAAVIAVGIIYFFA